MDIWVLWVCVASNLFSCTSVIKSEMTKAECYESLAKIPSKNLSVPSAFCYKKEK